MALPAGVRQHGLDSSNRPIYASDEMWAVWLLVLAHPRVERFADKVTITQGAWMAYVPGGGADASSGYHDEDGTFDLRVWNLEDDEVADLIWVLRFYGGAAAWLRNLEHGGFKDAHIHLVFCWLSRLSAGARSQVAVYKSGRSGLASNGSDYHPRPSPLVLTPPEEDPMADYAAQLDKIQEIASAAAATATRTERKLDKLRESTFKRDRDLKLQVRAVLASLADDPAVDKKVIGKLTSIEATLDAGLEPDEDTKP